MTSVWFAASGSGEDGDEYDVHEVFATQEAAQSHCDRPDKPTWEHRYVQEWKVTGSMLNDEEREAVEEAEQFLIQMSAVEAEIEILGDIPPHDSAKRLVLAATLRNLLKRLGGEK